VCGAACNGVSPACEWATSEVACTTPAGLGEGFCSGGACSTKLATLAACTVDSECSTGRCRGGTCIPFHCASNADCDQGMVCAASGDRCEAPIGAPEAASACALTPGRRDPGRTPLALAVAVLAVALRRRARRRGLVPLGSGERLQNPNTA
jgi:hypothetical protein